MPPAAGRAHQTDLLLCGHLYRACRQALAAAGATVTEIDPSSQPMAPGRLARSAPVVAGVPGDGCARLRHHCGEIPVSFTGEPDVACAR